MSFWAVLFVGLAAMQRPPELLNGAKPDAYAVWLDAVAREKHLKYNIPCTELRATPVGVRRLAEDGPEYDDIIDSMKATAGANAAFLETVRVEGCGRSSMQNLIVLPRPDGTWMARAAMSGATLAPLSTQVATLTDLQPLIEAGANCPEGRSTLIFGETQLLSRPRSLRYPLQAGDGWTERWPITICGRDISIDVTFTPTGNGRVVDIINPAPTNSLAVKRQ